MKPFYSDNHNTIYCMDFRKNDLPDESVQMVCTSPPYWGLRKYSGEQELIWSPLRGELGVKLDKISNMQKMHNAQPHTVCEHQWGELIPNPMSKSGKHGPASILTKTADEQHAVRKESNQGSYCQLCSAWRGAFGLEPTPELYLEHTIEILREIRRVLRSDGVCFWNIGDCYSATRWSDARGTGAWSGDRKKESNPVIERGGCNLPAKNLCLIPFRVAIAAQEDGWWVRSVIIWSKPNPMPESVTDRPTESHEYILMLTKSKKYYWDADAVREQSQANEESQKRALYGRYASQPNAKKFNRTGKPDYLNEVGNDYGESMGGRNIRSVWEFPTQPYPEAHFAVFPEKLPEKCIKAATPEVGCCSECGAPWERIVKKTPQNVRSHKLTKGKVKEAVDGNNPDMAVGGGFSRTGVQFEWEVKTLGWQPTCKCNADKVPSIVLDPFSGAGTTLWVAKKLNRRAVGYEISEEYCQLAVHRCRQQVMV